MTRVVRYMKHKYAVKKRGPRGGVRVNDGVGGGGGGNKMSKKTGASKLNQIWAVPPHRVHFVFTAQKRFAFFSSLFPLNLAHCKLPMSLVGQPVEDASVGGGGVAAAASTTQQQQRRRLSSAATTPFRRSLNLTYGASALLARRFSRSRSNAAETPTPQPGPVRRQQRRSTISTTTAPPPQPAIATTTNQQQQKQPTLHVRIVPNIEDPSRSLIFNIVDRELSAGTIIKIGRFAERSQSPNHMSFKSKVVSRAHCEVWVDLDGKVKGHCISSAAAAT